LNLDQFVDHQRDMFRYAVSSLLRDCVQRFLSAAYLLEVSGEVTDGIEKSRKGGTTNLTPLRPVWQMVCIRYREEQFSPQTDWLVGDEEQFVKPWSDFIYWRLFPVLLRSDRFVRNLLRAVGQLPCASVADAVAALMIEVTEMTLPNQRPPYFEFDGDL